MPRTKGTNLTKTGKLRKKTRRKETTSKIVRFKFNGRVWFSCYDIRNFLSDNCQFGEGALYEFRKRLQNLERKNPNDRFVVDHKFLSGKIDKIHINPNKSTPFIISSQVEHPNGFFNYLLSNFNMPVENECVEIPDLVPSLSKPKNSKKKKENSLIPNNPPNPNNFKNIIRKTFDHKDREAAQILVDFQLSSEKFKAFEDDAILYLYNNKKEN